MTGIDPLTVDALTGDELDLCAFRFREESLTYRQLVRHVAQVRAALEGVSVAALVAAPDLPSIVWLHACLSTTTPVLLLHPRLPAAERQRLLAFSGASILLDGAQAVALQGETTASADCLLPGDQVLVPTSGSSGQAKIAVLTRAALVAAAQASANNLPLGPGDCWALALPFAHVGGLSVLTRSMLGRAAVRILPASSLDSLRDGAFPDVTHLSLVPTQLRRWVQANMTSPPSLRSVLVGGAPIPAELRQAARRHGYPLLCTYGMTEMASQIATQASATKRAPDLNDVDSGRPLIHVDIRITSDDEICVRGPQLARGYWGSGALTDADGFFHTGDLGRLDADGRLIVLGRKDRLLISGGENVAPEVVEAALLDHPHVAEACVVGVPDDEWGMRIVAVVRWSANAPLAAANLRESVREELRTRLPTFAVPKELIPWSSLPALPSGKIDRAAIQAQMTPESSAKSSG